VQFLDNRDGNQRGGNEGNRGRDHDAEKSIPVLLVPQLHASRARMQAHRTVGAGEGHRNIRRLIAGRLELDEAPIVQIAQGQFECSTSTAFLRSVDRYDRTIETLQISVLMPAAAVGEGMRREPEYLLASLP